MAAIMTNKERLLIEKFLRVADEENRLGNYPVMIAERHDAIKWLRSLLNNDEIRKLVSVS